jgi:[ribosomal protein S18]-alanine N-acetyltransferase
MVPLAIAPMRSRRSRTSPSIDIRPAGRADLEALVKLEHLVFTIDRLSRQSMRRLLASPTARVILAELDERIAGAAVVLFRRRSTVARLYSIGVAPHLSGRGVAVALLMAVEAAATAGRCRCLRLEVHETNAAAIARYRKSGFREIGRQAAYYEDGGDALRFEKLLDGAGPSRR